MSVWSKGQKLECDSLEVQCKNHHTRLIEKRFGYITTCNREIIQWQRVKKLRSRQRNKGNTPYRLKQDGEARLAVNKWNLRVT